MARTCAPILAALIAVMLPVPVAAQAPLEEGWPLVAFARDGECELTVTGNGKVFRLMATGLPGTGGARLHLSNADMKPIDRPIRSDAAGTWRQYYLPFVPWQPGGEVNVSVETETCRVTAGFPWQRGIRVID